MPYSLDYACYLNSSGYAQAAVDTILALDASGNYDIRITCFHDAPARAAFSRPVYEKLKAMTKKPINRQAVRVFHCIPDQQARVERMKHNISFATFETFEPPSHWSKILNRSDAVVCPSLFNYKIFAHAGVTKPIFHVPHCIDTDQWNKDVGKMHSYDKFTFLFVGTWKRRKGWPQLIEAWCREFSSKDNTQLIIKTDKVDVAERNCHAEMNNLRGIKKDIAPILFERTIFDNSRLPAFFKSANCLISPTLGEGFGLPAMQCMALGVPVITTDFSGCQDYANENTCTLLKPTGFMLYDCIDAIPQFKNKKWPRITIQNIQDAMRHVLSSTEVICQKSQNAYEYVRSNFAYDTTVRKFDEIMESIYSGKPQTQAI